MIFHSDMHIHTFASVCCSNDTHIPENIIPLLAQKGYKKIGFVDHLWDSKDVPPSNFYVTQDGKKHLELYKFIHSREWEIEVLVGCEADMKAPGVFGITHELKEKLDYVAMATDHFHMRSFVEQPSEQTPRALGKHMLTFFISAAESGLPDILVHPFYPYGYIDLYDEAMSSMSDAELIDAFSIAASKNIAIELNKCCLPKSTPERSFSIETSFRIFTLAKQAGCKFTFGSDAHSLETFVVLDQLQSFARSLNITKQDIHPIAQVQ